MKFPITCFTIGLIILVNNNYADQTKINWKYFVSDVFKSKPIVTDLNNQQPTAPPSLPAELPSIARNNQTFSLPNAPTIPAIETNSNRPPNTSPSEPEVETIPSTSLAPDDIFATIITVPLQPLTNIGPQQQPAVDLAVSSGLIDQTLNVVELAQAGNVVLPTTTGALTQCSCVPTGTCVSINRAGNTINTRIVNQNTGVTCPTGQQYCCTAQGGSQVSSSCGLQNIISGVSPGPGQANFGQYPWSGIILTSSNVFIGGATLISPTYLLTAAHLVSNYGNGGGLKIRLGEWDMQGNYEPQPALEIPVAGIVIHPSFVRSTLQNDLAIITLQSNAPQLVAPAPQVNSICLPGIGESFNDQTCFVAGWGRESFTGNYQNILKQVDLQVIGSTNCQTRLRQTKLGPAWNLDSQSFICAGGVLSKDACQGDGGSALACLRNGRYYVAGITAGGVQCGLQGVPGLYVNVANFISWINLNTPIRDGGGGGGLIDPRRLG